MLTWRAPDGLSSRWAPGWRSPPRSVRLEGIAFVGGPPIAVDATVADGVVLTTSSSSADPPSEHRASTVQLVAEGGRGPQAGSVTTCSSFARTRAAPSSRRHGRRSRCECVAASTTAGDALLALDSVAALRLRYCALAAWAGRRSSMLARPPGRDRGHAPLGRGRRCWPP